MKVRFYDRSKSGISFTHTGTEIYWTSSFLACPVTSYLLELMGGRFVMSLSKTLSSLYAPLVFVHSVLASAADVILMTRIFKLLAERDCSCTQHS